MIFTGRHEQVAFFWQVSPNTLLNVGIVRHTYAMQVCHLLNSLCYSNPSPSFRQSNRSVLIICTRALIGSRRHCLYFAMRPKIFRAPRVCLFTPQISNQWLDLAQIIFCNGRTYDQFMVAIMYLSYTAFGERPGRAQLLYLEVGSLDTTQSSYSSEG